MPEKRIDSGGKILKLWGDMKPYWQMLVLLLSLAIARADAPNSLPSTGWVDLLSLGVQFRCPTNQMRVASKTPFSVTITFPNMAFPKSGINANLYSVEIRFSLQSVERFVMNARRNKDLRATDIADSYQFHPQAKFYRGDGIWRRDIPEGSSLVISILAYTHSFKVPARELPREMEKQILELLDSVRFIRQPDTLLQSPPDGAHKN
jgi:hypothetical protein